MAGANESERHRHSSQGSHLQRMNLKSGERDGEGGEGRGRAETPRERICMMERQCMDVFGESCTYPF